MKQPFVYKHISDILVDKGYVTHEQWTQGSSSTGSQQTTGDYLVKSALITSAQLAESLAEAFNLSLVDISDFLVPGELFNVLPAAYAYQYQIVPYQLNNDVLTVVVGHHFNSTFKPELESLTGKQIQLMICDQAVIHDVLHASKGHVEELKDITENFRPVLVKESDAGEQTIALEDTEEDGPVIRFVNALIKAALQKRSSDIHIESYENGIIVKNRIDGVLYPATEMLDPQYHSAMVSRLKIMAELDIAEKRVPQDGRFRLRVAGRDIDFRVSVLPSIYGEDIVIRILDKSSLDEGIQDLSLDKLGLSASVLASFRKSIREPYGMVLITGPTGSGKTTTLYAALSEFDVTQEKIITIEDPVEYQLEGVVQIPVNEKKDLTFAKGLRSILRHDPDKIMVGEIRDRDTVQIAIQSALTGHLVFTTVHANNAFDVIGRFSHMGVDIYSFVSALNCVMAQRLVRRICEHCKTEINIAADDLKQAGLKKAKYKDQKWYAGTGCHECGGTGYLGRIAICEYLNLSPRIREMIVAKRPLSELYEAAVSEGMVTLRQSAIDKVLTGETTLQEANRVTFMD